MKVIGIVGQIAAGKTTVVDILEDILGAYVINVDKVGHKLLKKDNLGYEPVINAFGEQIVDASGEIDRKTLGNIVFSDPAKLAQLNDISHPLIYNSVKDEIETIRTKRNYNYIVVDAALLIEIKLIDLVDEVWGVYVDPKQQIKRVMNRNKISQEEAVQRISSQLNWDIIKKFTSLTIDNSRGIDCTKEQIRNIVSKC